jgi:internalin A
MPAEQPPRPAPSRPDLFTALVALLSAASWVWGAVLRHTREAPPVTLTVLVSLASAPLIVLLARSDPDRARRFWSPLWAVAGLLAVVAGGYGTWHEDALQLLRLDFPASQVATNAAAVMAPVALTGVGVALLLGAAALFSADRVVAALAGAVTVLISAGFAAAVLAFSANSLHYRGGAVQPRLVIAAALLAFSTVLLPFAILRRGAGAPAGSLATATAAPRRLPAARLLAIAASLALVAGVGAWTQARLANRLTVTDLFPDPALAACVASGLHLAGAHEPTSRRKLNSVFGLDCNGDLNRGGRITSLAGLDQLPNLTTVDLSSNQITDLALLRQAPHLTSLKLTNNQVSDLLPLTDLHQLRNLGLSRNQITDLTPLTGLTGLATLGLSDNHLTDLTPLAGLQALTELDVGRNQITDVQPLAGLSVLDRLTMNDNQVATLGPLTALPALTMLNVTNNRVRNAAALTGLAKVDELWLGGNPVTDLLPLRRMPALRGVDLEGSDPSRLTGIEKLRADGIYVGGLA